MFEEEMSKELTPEKIQALMEVLQKLSMEMKQRGVDEMKEEEGSSSEEAERVLKSSPPEKVGEYSEDLSIPEKSKPEKEVKEGLEDLSMEEDDDFGLKKFMKNKPRQMTKTGKVAVVIKTGEKPRPSFLKSKGK